MAFCGTRLDEAGEGLIQEQLLRRKIRYVVRKAQIPIGREQGARSGEQFCNAAVCPHPNPLPVGEGKLLAQLGSLTEEQAELLSARMIFLVEENVPVTLFENASTRGGWFGAEEVGAFLAACDIFLRKNRPDVVITYGGDPVSIAVQELAKWHGATVVFWLHNFGYFDRTLYSLAADYVVVHAEFTQRYYRETLGLNCHRLPYIVHWKEAAVTGREQRARSRESGAASPSAPRSVLNASYVTFINPQATKGVFVFARIARELARRRPDIPLLVTQGRSPGDALRDPALGLAPHLAKAAISGGSGIRSPTKAGTVRRETSPPCHSRPTRATSILRSSPEPSCS